MGSPFDAAMAAADAAIDAVFGEPFLVTPRSNGAATDGDVNDLPRADAARGAPLQIVMTIQESGDTYFPASRGSVARNAAQKLVGANVKLSVLDRNLPWQPAEGDLAQRVKNGVTYRVAKVEPDDAGRIWLPVTIER